MDEFQPSLFRLEPVEADVVYTPVSVAIDIITWLSPSGVCLDPCKGDGAFLHNLPIGSKWCEITEGLDFFDFNEEVDWIIGNPPYSIFEDWLRHSFELAPNVCYLVPTNKVFQRLLIMEMINNYGGIKGMKVYGSGSNVGFPFGFSVGAFYFARDYKGQVDMILHSEPMI